MAVLPGCRFAPRCALVEPGCTEAEPALPAAPHGAACFRTALTPTIATVPEAGVARVAREGVLLDVRGLTKRFTTGGSFRRDTTIAVQDVAFHVAPREFVAVVGESGSGKSTLGRLLVGLERPSAGRSCWMVAM